MVVVLNLNSSYGKLKTRYPQQVSLDAVDIYARLLVSYRDRISTLEVNVLYLDLQYGLFGLYTTISIPTEQRMKRHRNLP